MSMAAIEGAQEPPPQRRSAPILLLLAYPLLVHLAVVWSEPQLEWLALVLLCAMPQYAALRAGRPGHWLLLLAMAGLLQLLTRAGGGMHALFLPPVVVPAVLLAVFAGSLRAGQLPLVTRVAQAVRGPLEPALLAYTRQVTWLWVLVLATLTVADAALALFASPPLWSLFCNFINYVLVGLVFALEYGYRRRRFPAHAHDGFLRYMRGVARVDYKAA